MPDNLPPDRLDTAVSTSRSLLQRLRDDQPAAWERLVSLYSPLVHYWCRRFQLPEQDMPDVFQQVFQSVALHIHRFRKDRPESTFRGWLRVITRNKVRDHFRRKARQPDATGGTDAQIRLSQLPDPFSDEADDEQQPADPEEEAVYQSVVQQALASIRPHFHATTWQAFWKVVVDGRTAREAAEELGMRPGTVRVAKSRVLARLRRELAE